MVVTSDKKVAHGYTFVNSHSERSEGIAVSL